MKVIYQRNAKGYIDYPIFEVHPCFPKMGEAYIEGIVDSDAQGKSYNLFVANNAEDEEYKFLAINFCPFCGEKIEYIEDKGV